MEVCREGVGGDLAEHTDGVTRGHSGHEQEARSPLLDGKLTLAPDALLGFLARAGDRQWKRSGGLGSRVRKQKLFL